MNAVSCAVFLLSVLYSNVKLHFTVEKKKKKKLLWK